MATTNIGLTTVGTVADSGNGNLLVAQSATLTAQGLLTSLSFYVTTAAGTLYLGVYDATGAGGTPGRLIATTASFTPVVGWNTQATTTTPLLAPGTYWLTYLPSSNSLAFVLNSTGSSVASPFTYAALPSTFPTASEQTGIVATWSLYATLTLQPPIITINAIANQTPNTPFTVNGSLQYETAIPTLTFQDGSGPVTALPSGSSVSLTGFSFTHPGLATANYTLTISDGTVSASTTFSVIAPGWTGLPATTSLSQTITGLLPNTLYNIEVYATNSAGQGPPSAIISATTLATTGTAPGVPTGLSITASSQASLTFSWTAPTSGTTPFTYNTRSSPTGLNTWTAGPTVSVTSAQIAGLSAGTTYDVEVQAANSVGSGSFSSILTATTQSSGPAAVTWQPTGATASMTFSNGNLTATSTAATAASCLSTTTITSSSGLRQFEATISAITIDWQVGICNQSFNLAAALGLDNNGVAFNPAFQNTVFCGSAAALTTGSSSSVASDIVTVVFDPSVPQIWVSSGAMRTAGFAWNNSPTATPSTLTGGISLAGLLTPGSYSAIFNERQSGGICIANFGATAFTVPLSSNVLAWNGAAPTIVIPGSVTGLTAGTPAQTTIPLTWTAPATGTLAFTYTVWVSPHGANTYTANASSQVPSATATGLTANTSYDIKVSAANGAGSGGFSAVVTISTAAPITVPSAPSGLSVGSTAPNAVSLTWVAPTTGSAPTGYQVQFKLSTAGTYSNFAQTTTGTSQTITGLTAATTYNFQVYAFNSAGNGAASAPAVSATTLAASASIPILDARVQNPAPTVTDSGGTTYSISLMAQVVINGVTDTTTSQVSKVAVVNGVAWQGTGTTQGRAGSWWFRSGSTWVAGSNPLPSGLAIRTYDLLRTWGYNIHINYMTTSTRQAACLAAIQYLNTTLLRGECFEYQASDQAIVNYLQQQVPGLRWNWLLINQSTATDGSAAAGVISNQVAQTGCLPVNTASFESVNEPINFRSADTVQILQTINSGVGNAVRGFASQNGAPVVNLSNSGQGSAAVSVYQQMGDQTSNKINWGCWHGYANDGSPSGAPEIVASCIPAAILCAAASSPGRPWCMTEWGWEITSGAPNGNNMATPNAGGPMTINGFLDGYYYGAAGMYFFAIWDDTGEGFQLFGGTPGNPTFPVTPNPWATAIHNFTTVLLDTSATAATFTPTAFSYTISGSTNYTAIMTQKADLSFQLIVWNDDPVQNTGSNPTDRTPAAVNLTVSFGQAVTSVAIYDPIKVGVSPVSTFPAGTTSVPIAIQGYAKIVRIIAA